MEDVDSPHQEEHPGENQNQGKGDLSGVEESHTVYLLRPMLPGSGGAGIRFSANPGALPVNAALALQRVPDEGRGPVNGVNELAVRQGQEECEDNAEVDEQQVGHEG